MELKEILEHHIIDHIYNWISFLGLKLPISKHFLMILIASFILLIVFPIVISSKNKFLFPFRSMIEIIVLFIRDEIVIPNLGEHGKKWTHYFSTLFFFILIANLLGFVPFGATATGNLAVTGGLALTTFILINFMGMKEQGFISYFKHMVPSGMPLWLYPLLFPIELIGLLTKTFALAIRLFANMIAGHIVMLVFIAFIFIFGAINPYLGLLVVAPISVFMVLFISFLELLVAFLQAYVFTFLTAIFTGLAIHPH
jgi:F-type H+-transporting ATPase subunit a